MANQTHRPKSISLWDPQLLDMEVLKTTKEGFLNHDGSIGVWGLRAAAIVDMSAMFSNEQLQEFNKINPWHEALQAQLQCETDEEVGLSDRSLSSAHSSWEFTELFQLRASICQVTCD